MKRPGINKYDEKLLTGLVIVNAFFVLGGLLASRIGNVSSSFPFTQTKGWQRFQTVSLTLLILGLFGALIYQGVRSVGYAEGKESFASQAILVFWRVFLYLFLPAAVITLTLVLYALYRRSVL
ncbi:MAG: hypothetical protein KIH63_000965 [Candidatus Saccharibacteria bacterium]|nr:hypothetical protein [Candidatus Saccharibacteria bacterium]